VWFFTRSPSGRETVSPGGSAEDNGKKEAPATVKVITNSLGMKLVRVPAGKFWMGGGPARAPTRTPQIRKAFYLGDHEVTQGQWHKVMGNNPSFFSPDGPGAGLLRDVAPDDLNHLPVDRVSWDDVQVFLEKLNELEKGMGRTYRLPSEAEWEYACRGAPTSRKECLFDFYLDKPSNRLTAKDANFWAGGEGRDRTRPTKVGSYRPNRLGLYDMHGNVWEWCQDRYDRGEVRVVKGGCWYNDDHNCKASHRGPMPRDSRSRDVGFRVVCDVAP
jgi:formylglycine-generating enzyme required for sulfatase activity